MKLKRTLILVAAFTLSLIASAQGNREFSANSNDGEYCGMTVGWVAKEWETNRNGQTLHEDLWGNPNKMLHGVQVGYTTLNYTPCGFGWKSGLYFEWYHSEDEFLKMTGWDRFNEYCLYFPIHAMWKVPLSQNISIIPYGGIGINWAIVGITKNGDITDAFGFDQYGHYGNSVSQKYNYNDNSPHHWNVQLEGGVMLRFNCVTASFTYSRGLNHHQLYNDAYSIQNKLSVNVSYVIPGE